MDGSADSPQRPQWPWVLWGLTTLVLFGISTGARFIFNGIKYVYYQQLEMKAFPHSAELAMDFGPYLWIAAAAISVGGLVQIRRQDSSRAMSWLLVVTLLFLILCGLLTYALWTPLLYLTDCRR